MAPRIWAIIARTCSRAASTPPRASARSPTTTRSAQFRALFGSPVVDKTGQWNLTASYRHIQPDALLDAFTDSDFHLGGPNAKGWTIGASYGLTRNPVIGARGLSSSEVSGPPFKVDLLQVDMSVHF